MSVESQAHTELYRSKLLYHLGVSHKDGINVKILSARTIPLVILKTISVYQTCQTVQKTSTTKENVQENPTNGLVIGQPKTVCTQSVAIKCRDCNGTKEITTLNHKRLYEGRVCLNCDRDGYRHRNTMTTYYQQNDIKSQYCIYNLSNYSQKETSLIIKMVNHYKICEPQTIIDKTVSQLISAGEQRQIAPFDAIKYQYKGKPYYFLLAGPENNRFHLVDTNPFFSQSGCMIQ
jgi:hypothetical protein